MIRIIDTGILTGAENMAWDETLLTARARGIIPDTLRYLRFSPPATLVGYHQAVSEPSAPRSQRGEGEPGLP